MKQAIKLLDEKGFCLRMSQALVIIEKIQHDTIFTIMNLRKNETDISCEFMSFYFCLCQYG
jgi:hypothetical protein